MAIPLLTPTVTTDELRRMVAMVRGMPPATDSGEGVERVRLLEELVCAAQATQMREAVTTAASLEARNVASGVPSAQRSRGVANQLALAKMMSPHQAQRFLGNARILIAELPRTFAALEAGRTTAWRAMLVARETLFLSREHRADVDREICDELDTAGDRAVERLARAAACRLDPAGAAERARRAAKDRHVSLRPAPDVMTRLSALLPVAEGVAAYAALSRHADLLIGTGQQGTNADGTLRTRGQIMADTLVERLTGQAVAGDVPVEIELVMPADTLIEQGADEPAIIPGYGPVPAPTARNLALGQHGDSAPRWLRRLFLTPDGTQLANLDSRRRLFTDSQRRFLRLRDQGTCRTPFCDAPARHYDHIRPDASGGPTRTGNGQGLCEACNYAKEAAGWRSTPARDGTIDISTPTGQHYRSAPPRPPGGARAA